MSRPGSAASRTRCAYTLAHLDELVVKPVGESGGYGMLIGPRASQGRARGVARERLKADPANYIGQPMISLSVSPDAGRRRASSRATSTCGRSRSPARDLGAARRPDPRGAARGLAGGQLLPGRRLEGHLGAGGAAA